MNLQWHKWSVYVSTLGPIGYFPASGTVATLITIPFVWWLNAVAPESLPYIGAVSIITCISFFVISKALPFFETSEDPSEIVLDEVVGCLIVFWSIHLTTESIIVGFILFRALDIIKFGLVKKAEKLVAAWGVMGDDIVAAVISNIILRMLFIS